MFAVSVALALLAGAPTPTRLKIDVKPAQAVVYVDGQKKGTGKKTIFVTVTPGRHKVKVTNGKDSMEDYPVVKKGETLAWTYAFEDDKPKPAAADSPAEMNDDKGPAEPEKP